MSNTLIPMIARVHLEYGGKPIAPREYFEALPIHAAVFNYQQKARLLEPGYVHREMEPEPAMDLVIAPDPEPDPQPEEPAPAPIKKKRTYRRRDMKAQK